MKLEIFFKGLILGFSIAAPVGPIGVLCIRKTLQHGRLSGFFSCLGAAAADTIYGIIAAFGLTMVSDFMTSQQLWLRLIGGAFLIYLGISTYRSKPYAKTSAIAHKTLTKDFISTFLLTMTNPMTILTFLAIFAGLGFTGESNTSATWLVSGVFFGSTLWWLILSEGVTLFRKKLSPTVMVWVNRFAGMLIMGFGAAALISVLKI
jgi:threonine/homoserine/homoserine lactone efflux protein